MDYVFQLHTVEHQITKDDKSDKHEIPFLRHTFPDVPEEAVAEAMVCNYTSRTNQRSFQLYKII